MTTNTSKTTGHTPGPWMVGNGDVFAEGNRSSDFDDIVICAIGQSGGFRSHEYAVVKAHKPEGRANARLIAAAPDMLNALKTASWLLADISPDGLVKKQIDEVIAKVQQP